MSPTTRYVSRQIVVSKLTITNMILKITFNILLVLYSSSLSGKDQKVSKVLTESEALAYYKN